MLGELFVLIVNFCKDALIQLECDDAALVEHGSSCVVLYCLSHVVDVNIIAENLASRSIFGRNRGTGKADESRIRKGTADEQRGARVLLAVTVVFLLEPVLPAVRFIYHHDDVLALGEGDGLLLELLHGGENDAVGAAARDLLRKVGAALRLNGRLAQKV